MSTRSHTIRPELYLKEIGSDLVVLYVEDDATIQSTMTNILTRFFKHIDTAANGAEGLEMMKKRHYDLLISDILMPVMDGIEMISEAFRARIIEKVIITSAHNEADKIISLINLGVDGFIIKPIEIQQLLNQLIRVCEPIHEHKILEHYIKELEIANNELQSMNEQMNIMMNEIENHPNVDAIKTSLIQAPHATPTTLQTLGLEPSTSSLTPVYQAPIAPLKVEAYSAEDFHNAYPIELGKKNEDLENIEDDYDMLLAKVDSTSYSPELLTRLTEILKEYAETIETIPNFTQLAIGIEDLANTFASITDASVLERLMPMISSLFDTLHRWRLSVFVHRNAEDIHYLDDSIISDAQALKSMLGFAPSGGDDESELELF